MSSEVSVARDERALHRTGERQARELRCAWQVAAREPQQPAADAAQRLERLAQRTARQEAAIADRVRRIHHDDVEVALELVVLQAVVEQEHVGAARHRLRCQQRPPGTDQDAQPGAAALEQERLVSREVARHPLGHLDRLPGAPPVAAAEQSGLLAAAEEPLGQLERDGGLAGASHHQVSHRDDRRSGLHRTDALAGEG